MLTGQLRQTPWCKPTPLMRHKGAWSEDYEDYEDVICYMYLILGLRAIGSDPTRPLCVTPSNKH